MDHTVLFPCLQLNSIHRFHGFHLQGQSVDLLPDVVQQQLKSGKLPEAGGILGHENIPAKTNVPAVQEPIFGNLLFKAPQGRWEGNNGFLHSQP